MLRNGLEWVVGGGELVDKPVVVVTASPSMTGGDRAMTSWVKETLEVMGAHILPESLPIPLATAAASPTLSESGGQPYRRCAR
ncbi:hypothetical protein [Streptomyces sp. NPDC001930]|uniref:hypothetical protein n=1 Tax=Streptomyces sp. NPDC001930 TaxID=3364625 RepID=UPI00368B77BE